MRREVPGVHGREGKVYICSLRNILAYRIVRTIIVTGLKVKRKGDVEDGGEDGCRRLSFPFWESCLNPDSMEAPRKPTSDTWQISVTFVAPRKTGETSRLSPGFLTVLVPRIFSPPHQNMTL